MDFVTTTCAARVEEEWQPVLILLRTHRFLAKLDLVYRQELYRFLLPVNVEQVSFILRDRDRGKNGRAGSAYTESIRSTCA